jgi:putative hydrolase of the HAD superfamily
MKRRLLIFDLFGVVITEPHIVQNLLRPLLPDRDVDYIHTLYGAYEMGNIDDEAFWGKLSDEDPSVLMERFFASTHIHADLDTVFAALRNHFDFAILSNSPAPWKSHFLQEGLGAYFIEFFVSGEIGKGKPDPSFYLQLCDKTGYASHDCVIVDDRKENLASASELGMKTIWLKTDADQTTEHDFVPDLLIHEIGDLTRIL